MLRKWSTGQRAAVAHENAQEDLCGHAQKKPSGRTESQTSHPRAGTAFLSVRRGRRQTWMRFLWIGIWAPHNASEQVVTSVGDCLGTRTWTRPRRLRIHRLLLAHQGFSSKMEYYATWLLLEMQGGAVARGHRSCWKQLAMWYQFVEFFYTYLLKTFGRKRYLYFFLYVHVGYSTWNSMQGVGYMLSKTIEFRLK